MSDQSSTIISKRFDSSASGSAWPAGVTKGSVMLVKDRASGSFRATLVAIGQVPQPLVTYYGVLRELPAFLVYVRLIDPPDVDPSQPVMDLAILGSGPIHDEEPDPGGPTGIK
jgi:hypothetical protein